MLVEGVGGRKLVRDAGWWTKNPLIFMREGIDTGWLLLYSHPTWQSAIRAECIPIPR
jgi:hypothetical protein